MNNELISVIMSVYNEKETWLREAIESILNQTHQEIEFIIILDNPDDKILSNIIQSYSENDNRIKFFKNKKNEGLVYSLNFALSKAQGKYIARMDADDISIEKRLETQLKFLKESNVDIVASGGIYINESGEEIGKSTTYGLTPELCKKSLKIKSILIHPSWLVKKEAFEKVGPYNYVTSEDYEWLCRAVTFGIKAVCLDQYLIKYRIRNNSICHTVTYQTKTYANLIKKEYKSCLKEKRVYSKENIKFNEKTSNKNKDKKFLFSRNTYTEAVRLFKNKKKFMALIYFSVASILSPYFFFCFVETFYLKIINKNDRKKL